MLLDIYCGRSCSEIAYFNAVDSVHIISELSTLTPDSKTLCFKFRIFEMASDSERESALDAGSWDLEKDSGFDASPNSERIGARISRRTTTGDPRSALQQWKSSAESAHVFTHPMTRQTTNLDVIVKFDGPNDPFRPINWSSQKKVVTVLLYGLTTACATWNSSM